MGTGPCIVLANGLGGTFQTWRHLAGHLAAGYRVVSWDYRGLHDSAPPPDRRRVRVEHHADDLEDLLAHLGIERALFIGWSMGVQVNFELYGRRPERFAAVAAINGTAGRPFDTLAGSRFARHVLPLFLAEARRYGAGFGLVARAATAWPGHVDLLRSLGFVAENIDAEVFRELTTAFARLDFGLFNETLRLLGEHDAWHVLQSIKVPTTIVTGERDFMTPVEAASRMSQLIPDSRLVVVGGGTHYAHLERPEKIVAAVDELIARAAPW